MNKNSEKTWPGKNDKKWLRLLSEIKVWPVGIGLLETMDTTLKAKYVDGGDTIVKHRTPNKNPQLYAINKRLSVSK